MKPRHACVCLLSYSSHVWLFVTLGTGACQPPLSMGLPRQEYWSGLSCHAVLQGIFPTQRWNLHLQHCGQILSCWATWEAQITFPAAAHCKWGSTQSTSCPGRWLVARGPGFKPKTPGCRSCLPNSMLWCQSVYSNEWCADSEKEVENGNRFWKGRCSKHCWKQMVFSVTIKWKIHIASTIINNLPSRRETWVQSLGWGDLLKKGMTTYFSILAWRSHGWRRLVGYSP